MINCKKLVSVVIPTYNVENYVRQAIQSVLDQSYQYFEVLVIDDGSTDGTVDVIKAFSDSRIRLMINKLNSGPAFSRNRGIEHAKGEWIAFLDSDDWWENTRLEKLLETAGEHLADIICDDMYLIMDGDQRPWSCELSRLKHYDLDKTMPIKITASFFIENQLGMHPLIKRDFLLKHGITFKEDLRFGEDFTLYLECLLAGASCMMRPEPLHYYRARKGSLITQQQNVLKQGLGIMSHFLNNPCCRQSPEVYRALQKQLKSIKESLYFCDVVQCFKEGEILKGISAMFQSPSQIPFIPKRSLQMAKGNLVRFLKRTKCQLK